MSIAEKALLYLFVIVVLLVYKFFKIHWSTPAGVYTLFSIGFILGAVAIFGKNIEYKLVGLLWWLVSCMFAMIGQRLTVSTNTAKSYAQGSIDAQDKCAGQSSRLLPKQPWIFLCIVIILGFCGILHSLLQRGISFSSLFNLLELGAINHSSAIDRYYGSTETTVLGQIFVIFFYLSPLCGGYLFCFSIKFSQRLLSIVSILPAFLSMAFFNGKAVFIAAAMLWISACLVSICHNQISLPKITPKIFCILVVTALGIISILYISMCLRLGDLSQSTREIINDKILVYAFGQVDAFSKWFDSIDWIIPDFGSNTFMVVPHVLGLVDRAQGVYEPIGQSNVFTANRGVIQDYGVAGGLLFWLLLGILSNYLRKMIKHKKYCALSITVMVAIYFFVFYGTLIISPWIYTTYVVAFCGFLFFLKLTESSRA